MTSANFNTVLLDNFVTYGENPAMMFKEGRDIRTITYEALGTTCKRIAAGLVEKGVERGDRIVVFAKNGPKWAQADIGSILAGAITSAVYASAAADELSFIINDLDASIVFIEGASQLAKLHEIRHTIPTVKKVFSFDVLPAYDDPWIEPFLSLLPSSQPVEDKYRDVITQTAAIIDGEDPLCVIYTSGTTGRPKGVVLTHNNYIKTIESLLQHIGDTERLARNLSFLPLAHAFERFAGYYLVLFMGRCIAFAESIDTILDDFRSMKPSFVVAVPRFFEAVHSRIMEGVLSVTPLKRKLFNGSLAIGHTVSRCITNGITPSPYLRLRYMLADRLVFRKVREAFGGELEFFVSGGAPLSPELAEFYHAVGLLILEGWGATEATTPSTLNKPSEFRFGSVGKALPHVQIRVADDGELEVKGPNVFKEYWKNREETNETFTSDGFYRTGDIGTIDRDGWVYIVDRKKQLIITSGGKNIAPAPIEARISQSMYIETAYVHGDRQHYLTALLVLNRHAVCHAMKQRGMHGIPWVELINRQSVVELIQREVDQANAELPRYMHIRAFQILPHPFSIESGELTHTMKLKRNVIRKKYKDLIHGMYG